MEQTAYALGVQQALHQLGCSKTAGLRRLQRILRSALKDPYEANALGNAGRRAMKKIERRAESLGGIDEWLKYQGLNPKGSAPDLLDAKPIGILAGMRHMFK